MTQNIYWNNQAVKFLDGETIANALSRLNITHFGYSLSGQTRTVFCGIGQCQNCLVWEETTGLIEACLTPCKDGLNLHSSPPLDQKGEKSHE